ncbi:hypothetical protein [Saccharopolyspora sp. NPDC050642]|uniref:hypothetical protein n=1 Tax=Saccharopolyspora sp. NPDC050642 TaxID=3157099 RepID=UPI0033E69EF7
MSAVAAITTRAETSHWAGLTTPKALNAADASHLGDSNLVHYRPGEFLGDEQR